MPSYFVTKIGRTTLVSAVNQAIQKCDSEHLPDHDARFAHVSAACEISPATLRRMCYSTHLAFELESINRVFRNLELFAKDEDALKAGFAHPKIKLDITISPAKFSDLGWIADAEHRYFESDAEKQRMILERWFNCNPKGFWLIRRQREIVGSIVLVPLKYEAALAFQEGEYTESCIKREHVHSAEEKEQVCSLYIENYINHEVLRKTRLQIELELCKQIKKLFHEVCELVNLQELYALEASDEGVNLMRSIGFLPCENQLKPRKDRHNMYAISKFDLLRNLRLRQRQIDTILRSGVGGQPAT